MSDEKPCVIKPGQSVIVIDHGYLLPDGSTISSVANCDFQDGSAIAFSYPNGPPPTDATQVVADAATPTVAEAVTPIVLSETATPTVVLPIDTSTSTVDTTTIAVVTAVTVAAVGGTIASAASAGKAKRLRANSEQQRQQEKEKEEQKKCDTASDAVSDKIKEAIAAADASRVHKIKIKEPTTLYDKIDDLKQEVSILSKVIKKKEKRKDP